MNAERKQCRRRIAGLGLVTGLLCAVAGFVRCVPPDPVDPCIDDEAMCRPDLGLDASRPDSRSDGSADAAATPDGAAVGDGGMGCPRFGPGTVAGRTPASSITEASGIVGGRRNPGTLWLHNDSGAGPRIYALSTSGTLQASYDLAGAGAQDWEDIAMGPGPIADRSYLYIGDIGDNALERPQVHIYRVEEPDVSAGSPSMPSMLTGVERFTLVYPDRAHNAETLLVDPLSGDVYIVVKSNDGVSPVFRAAAPLSTAAPITLSSVAVLRFGTAPLVGGRTTTAGDISSRGDEIAIRTYDAAYLWHRPPGMTVADALAGTPCALPLRLELQGEALGFSSDGSAYFTVSEGNNQPIYTFPRL